MLINGIFITPLKANGQIVKFLVVLYVGLHVHSCSFGNPLRYIKQYTVTKTAVSPLRSKRATSSETRRPLHRKCHPRSQSTSHENETSLEMV